MEKIFINTDLKMIGGEEGKRLIEEINDKKYFVENVGVPRVDRMRWEEAQKYEHKTWCDSPAARMYTDRNEEHEKNFGGYKQLNDLLENNISIIELGCGPFTNLRLILPKLSKSKNKIDLLDPLILMYLQKTQYCSYKTGILEFNHVNCIPSSIEDFIPTINYDLVVIINVLEHCFDIPKIFDNIYNMLNTNGIVLFHDKFIKDLNIFDNLYDAGHPLKTNQQYIETLIENRFIKVYKNEFENESGDNVYWILKKI